MKRPGRSLPPAAAVVLLGTLALAVADCARQQGPQPAEPPPAAKTACCDRPDEIPVTVFVTLENGKAITRNKKIFLCKGKDRVEWISCDGDLSEPVFTKDSPFDPTEKHEKIEKGLKSPKAKKAGSYPYTMELVLPSGKRLPVDPVIEVMP